MLISHFIASVRHDSFDKTRFASHFDKNANDRYLDASVSKAFAFMVLFVPAFKAHFQSCRPLYIEQCRRSDFFPAM